MLVDIHSHNHNVQNFKHFRFIVEKNAVGIHPWELLNTVNLISVKEKMNKLKEKVNSAIMAIGECGLDRRKKGLLLIEDQITVLTWHLDWALEVKKPIIIHCVHAYSDLIKILKTKKYKGKILIHDFSGNIKEAQTLLTFDCYFSFGYRLFNQYSKTAGIFKNLPTEKIFLETDDQKEFTIEDIYQKAMLLLGSDQVNLEVLFEKNLKSFFSDLNNIGPTNIIDNFSHS